MSSTVSDVLPKAVSAHFPVYGSRPNMPGVGLGNREQLDIPLYRFDLDIITIVLYLDAI